MQTDTFDALYVTVYDSLLSLEERYAAADEIFNTTIPVKWSQECNVVGDAQQDWFNWCQICDIRHALALAIADRDNIPSAPFKRNMSLLAWDHPDFTYHVQCWRDLKGVSPELESELAKEIKILVGNDYSDDPGLLDDLIAGFIGCPGF